MHSDPETHVVGTQNFSGNMNVFTIMTLGVGDMLIPIYNNAKTPYRKPTPQRAFNSYFLIL